MQIKLVEQRVQAAVAGGKIVGLALALIEKGQIVFNQGYGQTETGQKGQAVDAQTLFPFGSISKVLCATLVLRLVEQRRLDLDRPLLDYLPRLSFSNPAYGRRVLLRHVLSHTTGLPAAGRYYGPQGTGALQQVVETELPHYAFLAAPGTFHLYANTVYCLAGYAAEIVTGQDYDSLLREQVLEPLGVRATTFTPPPASSGRLALPHEQKGERLQAVGRLPANDAGHPSSFAYGTAADLARLALPHLYAGQVEGRRFLQPATVRQMQQQHASRHVENAAHPLAHTTAGYGLGLMTGSYAGNRVVRHGGMTLSCNCFFDLLPDQASGFVLLTNAAQEETVLELVAFLYDRLLGLPRREIVPLAAPAPFDHPEEVRRWAGYEGLYLNVQRGNLVEVRVGSGRLEIVWEGQRLPLQATGPGRYYAATEKGRRLPVFFLDEAAGHRQHLFVAGQPYHRYQVAEESGEWSAYVGCYRDRYNMNEEERVYLRQDERGLWLREGQGEEMFCEPLGGSAFRCNLCFFELEWDAVAAAPLLLWGKATRYLHLGETE